MIAGGIALVLLIAGSRLLNTYVDWLWFGEVGFRGVFTTVLTTRGLLLIVTGLLVGGVFALNLWLAYRNRPVFVPVAGPDDPVARYRTAIVSRLRLIGIGLPVAVGVLAGLAGQGDWQVVQTFLNRVPFGVDDPQFGHDISFYAFELPFWRTVLDWAFVTVVVSFIGALITHYIFGGIRLAGRAGQLAVAARVQLAILAGTFVLLKAFAYWLDRYELLFSERNERFTGATYTDLNAVLPAKLVLLLIAVICAAAFFVGAVVKNLQLPAIAIVLMVLSSVLVGAAWPAVLEQFSVRPNANQREAPSIERAIAATRQAYGLTDDKVKIVPYQGTAQISAQQIAQDTSTVPNVRLLDPSVIAKTFTQQQQRRNFYGFPEKLDVDRYTVDGETRDYIVAVREMNTAGLAPNQSDWINRHLIYTHGNGFVAAPANTIDSAVAAADAEAGSSGQGGFPVYTVSDLTTEGAIPVTQPRAYYGELVTDYAIVGAEGDQAPREYDTDSENYTYDGRGGVSVGNAFNRLAFSAYYRERNILFSGAIGDNSKIIYNRNPRDRVEDVAPWLTVDADPYPAVIDGRIQWIVDGYTTLDRYPYAPRTSLQEATQDSIVGGVAAQPNRLISYIRNSVKATVDAYDGTVTLYQFDEQDPVLKTWMGVFPDTVRPASDISPELREHFRYPEDLFKVQRELLSRYHVSDPSEFYSTVSFWEVPSDPTKEGTQAGGPQPPYYVLAGNPETGGQPSFQLTSALVSLRRQFLSAYMSASSDPDTYGQITVLQLPSETQTRGPQQVQNDFISSPDVSREINILRQQTRVTYGNLLTLPVAGGLLYVEPVYLERTGQESSYPQLARVLASYNGRVGYAPTLREALNQVFGAGAGEGTTDPGETGDDPGTPPPTTSTTQPPPGSTTTAPVPPPSGGAVDLDQAVRDISAAIEALRAAQQAGDFEAQGRAYAQLDEATRRYEEALAAQGSSTTTASAPPPPTTTGGG